MVVQVTRVALKTSNFSLVKILPVTRATCCAHGLGRIPGKGCSKIKIFLLDK